MFWHNIMRFTYFLQLMLKDAKSLLHFEGGRSQFKIHLLYWMLKLFSHGRVRLNIASWFPGFRNQICQGLFSHVQGYSERKHQHVFKRKDMQIPGSKVIHWCIKDSFSIHRRVLVIIARDMQILNRVDYENYYSCGIFSSQVPVLISAQDLQNAIQFDENLSLIRKISVHLRVSGNANGDYFVHKL